MVAVFHHIGEPTEDKFTRSLEQILAYQGLITFDGAYKEVYEHRQVLGAREPIMFIQWDTIGTDGVCTLDEIAELKKAGFTIGWHGHTHRRLTELTDDEIRQEIHSELGPMLAYAYPHGDFDERAKRLIEEAGYLYAYSTTQGDDSDYARRREYI